MAGYIFGNQFGSQVGKSSGQGLQIGRVRSIVMSPFIGNTNKPDPEYKSSADIGKIKFELLYVPINLLKNQNNTESAWPIFSFIKQYPLINEIVLITSGPAEGLNDSADATQFFYFPSFSLWNHPNHSAFPNMKEYSQYLQQATNKPGYSGTSNTDSENLPLGITFYENGNVRNMKPFEGDILLESRFGQSIRFGSTVSSMKKFNTWSNSGNNGDPITMIVNGQGENRVLGKFDPTVENINRDKSSIYLTSGQEIFLDDIKNFPLNSFNVAISITQQPVLQLQQTPISNVVFSAASQDKNV